MTYEHIIKNDPRYQAANRTNQSRGGAYSGWRPRRSRWHWFGLLIPMSFFLAITIRVIVLWSQG